jgi:allophanate hydrolase subunit 2
MKSSLHNRHCCPFQWLVESVSKCFRSNFGSDLGRDLKVNDVIAWVEINQKMHVYYCLNFDKLQANWKNEWFLFFFWKKLSQTFCREHFKPYLCAPN